MQGIYGSSGRTGNPLGVMAVMLGAIGAACSAALWVVQARPDDRLLGSFAHQVATAGLLRDQVILIAGVCGAICILTSVVGALGGRAKSSAAIGIVLGVVSLSYPVLSAMRLVGGPLRPDLF